MTTARRRTSGTGRMMMSPLSDIKIHQCEQLRSTEERLDVVAACSEENMKGEDQQSSRQ